LPPFGLGQRRTYHAYEWKLILQPSALNEGRVSVARRGREIRLGSVRSEKSVAMKSFNAGSLGAKHLDVRLRKIRSMKTSAHRSWSEITTQLIPHRCKPKSTPASDHGAVRPI
jgi:hypothetical protein